MERRIATCFEAYTVETNAVHRNRHCAERPAPDHRQGVYPAIRGSV
jgi:hypothetical protein